LKGVTKLRAFRDEGRTTLRDVARRNRGPVPEGVYHVWRRSAGPTQMYRDDTDRTLFCRRLAGTIAKYEWTLVGFVLMPTHFHLIVEVRDDVLQPGMRDTFGPYAQEFNRRHGRSGHLKAGPYKLRRIIDEVALDVAVRYVARNPVRAKLCLQPQDWTWSSYRGTAGLAPRFPFVDDELALASFAEDRAKAVPRLRAFVEAL
jgi:putative transposase